LTPLTAEGSRVKANGRLQIAWWKLPRGILRVLRLTNDRIECPNNKDLWRQMAMLVAGVLGGSYCEGL